MLRTPEKRLLLKSFGHGVFLASLVPPTAPSIKAQLGDGDKAQIRRDLEDLVRRSGVATVQEVVPHPDDPEAAFAVFLEGRPPCELERRQTEPEDVEAMARAAGGSERLRARMEMLELPA